MCAFAGCFLIRKNISNEDEHLQSTSYWNSIHVIKVDKVVRGECSYCMTSTILCFMDPKTTAASSSSYQSQTHLACSLTSQTEGILPFGEGASKSNNAKHIVHIGQMVEDVEIDLRSSMDPLYIQKTKEVVESMQASSEEDIRSMVRNSFMVGQQHAMMLNQAILARGASERC